MFTLIAKAGSIDCDQDLSMGILTLTEYICAQVPCHIETGKGQTQTK